jgi:hypothetical protein
VGRRHLFALKLLVPFLVLGSFSTTFASSTLPSCGSASLATYVTNNVYPAGGCAIGVLDYYNFSYTMGNGPAATALDVAPTASGFNFSLFGGAPIKAAPGQTVSFEIDYQIVIDPAPIISGGDLRLDPPTGNVIITEYYCNDITFDSGTKTCLGGATPDTLTLNSFNGVPSSASVVFSVDPARKFQDVGIVFTLNGGTTGASFDGLDADSAVLTLSPEPASAAGVSLGLLTLAGGYKLRKRRNG